MKTNCNHTLFKSSIFIMLSLHSFTANSVGDTSINTSSTINNPTPESQGWRRGILTIRFSVKQERKISWRKKKKQYKAISSLSMKAFKTEEIWIEPNLSNISPYTIISGSRHQHWKFEPYFTANNSSGNKYSSNINYTSRTLLIDNGQKTTVNINGKGTIAAMHIQSMHPSLFGTGYELTLNIYPEIALTESTSGIFGKTVNNRINSKALKFYLYPTPNSKYINKHPYNAIEKQYNKKQEDLDTLAAYQRIYSGADKIKHEYCIGTVTNASKDKLSINYRYTGPDWAPLVSDGTAGTADRTVLNINITLSLK